MAKLFLDFEEFLGLLVLISGSAFIWTVAEMFAT